MISLKEALIQEIIRWNNNEKYKQHLNTLNEKELQNELERVIMCVKYRL